MPSEQINKAMFVMTPIEGSDGSYSSRLYNPDVETVKGEQLETRNYLQLNWSKDFGSVQASIHTSMESLAAYVDAWRATGDIKPGDRGSVWVEFNDRHELTKLAEVAKRARNAAYGA